MQILQIYYYRTYLIMDNHIKRTGMENHGRVHIILYLPTVPNMYP